jgi:putative CocE/NonD family hydrolase
VGATAARQVGELDFGAAAPIDYDEVLLRFFDQYLRHVDTGLAAEPPVRFFVMGENRWRESATWPPATAQAEPLCLATAGDTATGTLADCDAASATPASRFIADPAKPVTDPYPARGPHDYQALANRSDLLVFDSATLKSSVTVAGNAVARVFVSCDCRDFDLWVRLLDVYPDGRTMSLMSPGAESLRASYRDIGNGKKMLQPGNVYELTLDGLLTSNRFAAGHRIQLQVSATFAPHLSRNLQTGESEMTSAASRPAEITLYHSRQYPSALVLPVLERGQ